MNCSIEVDKKVIKSNRLRFIQMAKQINAYLKEEKLNLNFEGYTETLRDYLKITNCDLLGLENLTYDLNLWSNYFGDLEGFIELQTLKFENKLLYLQGFVNKKVIDTNLDKEISKAKKQYKHFKLFQKHIVTQKKMFINAYRHCTREYIEALESILYKY
ncbi:TPA: hypothetical protein N2D99_002337 [Clostridium botulinum]|nr:hypothetical protein [Clostridium botulinum]